MIWTSNKHKQNAQDMAWLVRASFETGWRSAGGEGDWREEWRKTKARATLVSMGYIDDGDLYR